MTPKRTIILLTMTLTASLCHARRSVTYVDYVQSTNVTASSASYVKLDDVKPTGKWKIKIDFSLGNATRTMAVFSSKYRPSDKKRLCLYNISGNYRLDMYENRQHATGIGAVANKRQTFVYDAGKLYLDGKLITDASAENDLLTSENCEPITLLGDPSPASFGNTGVGRLFRVRMWDEDGAEVCDLHPCLDSEGVAALYDSVNDKIHYSQGAAFSAGEAVVPEGVEAIEYVETKNNGARGQWFNTGIVPEYGGRMELDCMPMEETSKTYCLWKAHRDENDRWLSLFNIESVGLRCDTSSKDQTGRTAYKGVRRIYSYAAGVFSVDGNVLKDSAAAVSELTDASKELVIGASYDPAQTSCTPAYPSGTKANPNACHGNFCKMRVFRFRYWNASGRLLLDLRPAKDSAGTAALFDSVDGKFIYHSFGGKDYTSDYYSYLSTLACGENAVFASAAELEYVEAQGDVEGGRQFFDTGFEPSGLAKFEMDVEPLRDYTGENYAFFSDRSAYAPDNRLNLYCLKNLGLRFDVNGKKNQTDYKPGTERCTVLYNAGVLNVDGTQVCDLSAEAATLASTTNRLFLLASAKTNAGDLRQIADSNFAKARLYGMKIWDRDGGTLLRDFEPRLDAAGAAGLYDKVGDKFYHSCSNEAVAGPRVGMPTQAQIDAASGVMDDAVFSEYGAKFAARSAFVQRATGTVVYPYAGKTRTVGYARFPQTFATTSVEDGEVVTATTGYASLGSPFSSASGTSWSAIMRVRREAKNVDAFMDTVLSLGTECDKDRVRIGFSGTEANRRLDVRVGNYQWPELTGVETPAGEWLDIAVVADISDSSVRVALCRASGETVWMEKTFAVDGVSLTNMAARATWNVKLGGLAAVDGKEAGRKSSAGAWTMFDPALEAFKGDVHQIALWDRALSDAEVLAAFSQVPQCGFMLFIR